MFDLILGFLQTVRCRGSYVLGQGWVLGQGYLGRGWVLGHCLFFGQGWVLSTRSFYAKFRCESSLRQRRLHTTSCIQYVFPQLHYG
jgi:hypothetical protein